MASRVIRLAWSRAIRRVSRRMFGSLAKPRIVLTRTHYPIEVAPHDGGLRRAVGHDRRECGDRRALDEVAMRRRDLVAGAIAHVTRSPSWGRRRTCAPSFGHVTNGTGRAWPSAARPRGQDGWTAAERGGSFSRSANRASASAASPSNVRR